MEKNDGLWWLMVAVGDGESSWNFRNGFGRKNDVFPKLQESKG